MVLEKTLESPLDCKEIQPVHSEGDQPSDFLEGMMLKLKLQYSGHLMRRADSLEKRELIPFRVGFINVVTEIKLSKCFSKTYFLKDKVNALLKYWR